MNGLAIDIERCQDGVELVDKVYRYRTKRTETERVVLADLEDPIVIAFVNATDDEERQRFFGRFGLPDLTPWWHQRDTKLWIHGGARQETGGLLPKEIHRDDILKDQSRFRRLLQSAGGEDPGAAMTAVNSALAKHREFKLQPTIQLAGPRGIPRLLLKSESLLGFMLMETAMVVANGARLAECEQCGTLFLTGTLTGRRSHARFCSDRCRVAAMRARNANIGG
jgi:hypothetical protein